MRHSNWTICSLLSQFCTNNFPTFDIHVGEFQRANRELRRGGPMSRKGGDDNQIGGETGFEELRVIKMSELQAVNGFFS